MPSDIRREIPSLWWESLAEVASSLWEPVELHCLGGFVAATQYGVPHTTSDLDYIEIIPFPALRILQELAGEGSALARKFGLYFQYFGMASYPDSYADRLLPLLPGRFKNIRLFALEAHDLALSKLARNNPVDREDVARVAAIVPLDPNVLRRRYSEELRHTLTGDIEVHDRTLEMWLAAYFPTASD
jgi:hypothetical protein